MRVVRPAKKGFRTSAVAVRQHSTDVKGACIAVAEKEIDVEELERHDGLRGPAYVAYAGRVYDVSGSFLWQKGNHQGLHRAGKDLTAELEKAPHGADFLERFPVVGRLKETKADGASVSREGGTGLGEAERR